MALIEDIDKLVLRYSSEYRRLIYLKYVKVKFIVFSLIRAKYLMLNYFGLTLGQIAVNVAYMQFFMSMNYSTLAKHHFKI